MRYQVYVIELSKKVFTENAKFRAANPQFNGVLQCLYVGMTSKKPAERFTQHKTGYVNKKGHKLSANIVWPLLVDFSCSCKCFFAVVGRVILYNSNCF